MSWSKLQLKASGEKDVHYQEEQVIDNQTEVKAAG